MAVYQLLFVGVFWLSCCLDLTAQTFLSKKIVQLNFDATPLQQVLETLKEKYQIQFSYSSDHLALNKKITYHGTKQSLNKAIRQLFKENNIACAYIGGQYALKPDFARQRKADERRKRKQERNAREQKTLDRERLFDLDIHSQLMGKKTTTLIQKPLLSTQEITPLMVTHVGKTVDPIMDSAHLFLNAKFRLKIRPKVIQVSLLPFLGTNGHYHHKSVNITSLNVIWGVNGGMKGLEIGGLGNHLHQKMQGLQIAGGFNRVEGKVQGWQLGGIANMGDDVYGIQSSSLSNVARDLYGLQLSGGSNIANAVYGCQATGLINFANGKLFGSQIAGVGNIAWGGKSAVQFAGLFNYSAKAQFQIASFLNMAQYIDGAQLGLFNATNRHLNGCQFGVLNKTKELKGVQIGIINSASNAKGFLLGLINVVDSINGISLGLINIVKHKGYNRVEIASGDVLYFQLGAKFGASRLYQMAQVGWQVNARSEYVWSLGGGLGTALPLTKHLQTNFELLVSKVSEGVFWERKVNLLQQLKVSLDVKIQERLSLFIGPTLNMHISQGYNTTTQEYGSNLAPYTFLNITNARETNFKLWIGIGGGLRF